MSVVLKAFFKKFRDDIQSNKDFRDSLNKVANHYLEEDVQKLASQISLINAKVDGDFKKKYSQALQVLASKGMTDVTFTKIASSLKEKFLDHFVDLKEIGVEVGHLYSVLTVASKSKAATLFNTEQNLKNVPGVEVDYSTASPIVNISDKDLVDIAKTVALISSYTSTLEELDRVQDRKGLIAFLKKSSTFRKIGARQSLTTIDDIKAAIDKSFEGHKGGKGFSELGGQILDNTIVNIEVSSLMDMKRSITASSDKVAVTFEIAAFNRLKGTLSKGIQSQLTKYLDSMMAGNGSDTFSNDINKALTAAIGNSLSKKDILELFPKVTSSKSFIQAAADVVASTIATGRSKTYSANSPKITAATEKINTKVKIPKITLKVPGRGVSSSAVIRPKNINTKPPTVVNLEAILRARINEQVRQNMGSGKESRILNYRTGRFSESVSIERLSESRQGMISVFYSYMKNPYATFSDGGRQQYPKTRDPKALISKSIREIAGPMVANRLRSVVV